jgi:hypothetical protein
MWSEWSGWQVVFWGVCSDDINLDVRGCAYSGFQRHTRSDANFSGCCWFKPFRPADGRVTLGRCWGALASIRERAVCSRPTICFCRGLQTGIRAALFGCRETLTFSRVILNLCWETVKNSRGLPIFGRETPNSCRFTIFAGVGNGLNQKTASSITQNQINL